jgi:hypothetical protein
VEADPGLIGQGGDPFGPEHGRQLAKQAGQTPGRHDRHSVDDDFAPGDLGTVDGHDRRHGYPRVGQDLGGLVGLPRHRPQCRGEGMAAMPQLPGRVELEAAPILLGVDHEQPTIEGFSARLRQEVDLDMLSGELLGVVDQTMEPTTVWLWLQPRAGPSSLSRPGTG